MSGRLTRIDESVYNAEDVRERCGCIPSLAEMYNAWLNAQIRNDTGRNLLEISESNAVLEIVPGTGGTTAQAIVLPWMPYKAPYTGNGTPPADQGLRMMLRPGTITDGFAPRQAGNANMVFVVPPNCFAFFVYAVVQVDKDGRMLSFVYASGTTLPTQTTLAQDDPDDLPPLAYYVLTTVSSTQTSVDYANSIQGATGNLQLLPTVTGTNERRMEWYPTSAITANGSIQ